jgi:hypothetical protein
MLALPVQLPEDAEGGVSLDADDFMERAFDGVCVVLLLVLLPVLFPLYLLGRGGGDVSYHMRRKGWLR